jgi:hypothetical protein
MALYAFDDLEDAFALTRSYLFPFSLGRWLRLALVVLFIGGATGNVPTANVNVDQSDFPGGFPADVGPVAPGDVLPIVLAVVAFFVLVGLVFGFIGSVMEFVLVDSLRSDVHVRRYFGEHLGKGFRLFVFRIVLFLLVAVPIVAVGAALVLNAGPDIGPGQVIGLLLVLFPLFLVLALVFGLVNAFTTSFVVPVMLLEGRGVLAGWRRFWPTLRTDWKEYGVYVVVAFILGAIANTAVGIAVGLIAVVFALPLVGVGAAGVAVGGFSTAVWGLVAVLVALFVLLVLAISAVVRVPVLTYFRYYALLLLGDTNAELDLIPEQRRGAREAEEREGPGGAADTPV